jgi:hypothetical protein
MSEIYYAYKNRSEKRTKHTELHGLSYGLKLFLSLFVDCIGDEILRVTEPEGGKVRLNIRSANQCFRTYHI